MLKNNLLVVMLSSFVLSSQAELKTLDDLDMAEVAGQGGVYLSGEFAVNKNGGPLWSAVTDENGNVDAKDDFGQLKEFRNCGSVDAPRDCGMRIAMKLNENSEGWYVLDDISGGFAFEGITLRTRTIEEAVNYDYTEDGGQTYSTRTQPVNDEVVEIGLPGELRFNDFRFKFAVANNGEFGVDNAAGETFRQTEIFGIELDGAIAIQGNLLLFPVD